MAGDTITGTINYFSEGFVGTPLREMLDAGADSSTDAVTTPDAPPPPYGALPG